MTLTLGTGPLNPPSPAQRNFDLPRHPWVWEDWPRRVRGLFAGEVVVDTRRAKLLHEPGSLPVQYFPPDDVRRELLEPSDEDLVSDPVKGQARTWSIRVGDRVADGAVRQYARPPDGAPPVADHLLIDFAALDAWFEEDEQVYAHPRDPYHRVDVRPSSRHVVVRSSGEVVADSTRPVLLFETGLPVRYYLPPVDVRVDLLDRSDTVSQCPYKGDGQHWHLRAGGRTVEDAAWSLPSPLPEAFAAAGHLCFYADRVEVEVDGAEVAS